MMESWEVVARESIRDLVARYNANGDSGRIAQVMALFSPEAEMYLDDGSSYEGLAEIRTVFDNAAASSGEVPSYIRHFVSTHQIDVADDRHATGRCYYQVLTAKGLDHWGRYIDEYERIGERWLFASRRVTLDGLVPGGWAHAQRPNWNG